jgi:hypothetical protein
MTPSELIAWHAHQITFLPETDNTMVQHHRDAMHCIERLRAELARMRDASEACTQEHDGLIAEQRTLRNAAVIATERAEKAEAELAACMTARAARYGKRPEKTQYGVCPGSARPGVYQRVALGDGGVVVCRTLPK